MRRALLRTVRAAAAGAIGKAVSLWPALERPFVRAGQGLSARSRLGGGLYWFAQEALIPRLRRSGDRYRAVRIDKLRLVVDVTDPTGRYPYFYATPYEPAVTDAVLTALQPGDVFLDVGANIGYFSTLAARLVGPTGRVIAFEPHDQARGVLRELAARNGLLESIEIVAAALADREEDLTLYTTDGFTSYSTLEPRRSPMRDVATFRPGATVHGMTMDAWLGARGDLASRLRCIKIDVEGAESRVIAGMRETLTLREVTIICETTIDGGADTALRREGYERHRLERVASSYGNFLYVRPGRSLAV